eukprot:403352336
MDKFQNIAAYDESISLQSVDLNQRILIKLEQLKTQPVIQMQDSFLGDDGCRILLEFFKQNSHSHISKLDLKGNNIGERGAIYLSQLLQENDSIRKISLEWNCVGVTDGGVQAICSALHHNTSVQELDLRNNQIQQSSAVHLADLLRANRTIKRLDLRWNELGKQGTQALLSAVMDNPTIQYIDLIGNKNCEDEQRLLETHLQRNRGELPGLRNLLVQGIPGESNDVPMSILQKEKDFAEDIRAKYEAQVIAHQRTEKKTKEIERTLENERRKYKVTNSELVKSLEEEKIARKIIESTLSKLKEDFARQELEKDKYLSDIQIKYDKIKVERAQYELELNKTREVQLRQQQIQQEKVNTLEDQLSKSQTLYVELDEQSKAEQAKIRRECKESLSEIHRRYEASLRQKDEMIKSLQLENENMKQSVILLKAEEIQRRSDEEFKLNEKVKEIMQIQRQFHDQVVQEQEQKLRMNQSHQDQISKLTTSMKQDIQKLQDNFSKDLEQKDYQINRIREEKANEQREYVSVQNEKNKLQGEVHTVSAELGIIKIQHSAATRERDDLQNHIDSIKDHIREEFQQQIQTQVKENKSIQERAKFLDEALNKQRNENQVLREKINQLKQSMQIVVDNALSEAFSNQSGKENISGSGIKAGQRR